MNTNTKPYIIHPVSYGPFVAIVLATGSQQLECCFDEIKADLEAISPRIQAQNGAVILDSLVLRNKMFSMTRFNLLSYVNHYLTEKPYFGDQCPGGYKIDMQALCEFSNWFYINDMGKIKIPEHILAQFNSEYREYNLWRCRGCGRHWKDASDFEDLCPFCENERIYIQFPRKSNWIDLFINAFENKNKELEKITSSLSRAQLELICQKSIAIFKNNAENTYMANTVIGSIHDQKLDTLFGTISAFVDANEYGLLPLNKLS